MADNNTYDAIVVGSGISGGWAAMELCKKGLKTIVLERGRQVEHIKDYPTTNLAPWELLHRNQTQKKLKKINIYRFVVFVMKPTVTFL
jgi:choline dehydrogenase-like flavoprotein